MSLLYILAPDGTHTPYEESQVREMLQQKYLTPETFYWKEGMTEWRPLHSLTGGAPVSAVPSDLNSSQVSAPVYRFTKNPEPLATIVKVLLVVSLFVALANLLVGTVVLIHTLGKDFKAVQLDARWMVYCGYLSLAVYLLTAIPFLKWIYRANLNCRGFASNMKFSSNMATFSYFIPFANLVYPCQAMQEIWKVSRNPANWQAERLSILVGFWWGFWILSSILGQVLAQFSRVHHEVGLPAIISHLEGIAYSLIALEISKIILCILAFLMIHTITQNQKRLTGQIAA
jgi:hypothetical protein